MDQPRTQEGNQSTAKDGFGVHLRREREMRGVTLEEISSATRIGTRFLDALETEHWDRLPGGVFNRGFVRTTAQFLGLDPEAMLAEYTLATTDSARPTPPVFIHSQSSWTPRMAPAQSDRRWMPLAALLAIVAIAAGGWFTWRHMRRARADAAVLAAASGAAATNDVPPAVETSAPAAAPTTTDAPDATSPTALAPTPQPATDSSAAANSAPSTTASAPTSDSASDSAATSSTDAATPAAAAAPVATPATAPASAPASTSGPLTLKIEVGRATTVSVSVDGHKSFRGKIPSGGSRTFQANQVFFVMARDAGGVLLELNGQTLPPLGPPGHSASIRLTRESLKTQDGTNH